MLIGYNTNVPYKGKNYHIQTEDSGMTNPCIVTHLYYEGAILSSAKTNYSGIIGHPEFEKELRELMKRQHREMIRTLISGKCEKPKAENAQQLPVQTGPEEATLSENPEPSTKNDKSLDDILLEHISRKVKK